MLIGQQFVFLQFYLMQLMLLKAHISSLRWKRNILVQALASSRYSD